MYGFYYSVNMFYWIAFIAVIVITIWAQIQVSHNFTFILRFATAAAYPARRPLKRCFGRTM